MTTVQTILKYADIHPEWHEIISHSLLCMDQDYLKQLIHDKNWLPQKTLLFSAFKRNFKHCSYILFGESPYPRKISANGIAFYDNAVKELWSETGLSKQVNRATSLRNIMKCCLLAENHLSIDNEGKITQAAIAQVDKATLIKDLKTFFEKLEDHGFLLCNATPVLHDKRKPTQEARYWQPFVQQLLIEISHRSNLKPTLVLWGKIAESIQKLPISKEFPHICCEHPYNISFIQNPEMLALFAKLKLLSSA